MKRKGFTIDQDTELRSTSEEKATVRYVRHSIEPDDIKNTSPMVSNAPSWP